MLPPSVSLHIRLPLRLAGAVSLPLLPTAVTCHSELQGKILQTDLKDMEAVPPQTPILTTAPSLTLSLPPSLPFSFLAGWRKGGYLERKRQREKSKERDRSVLPSPLPCVPSTWSSTWGWGGGGLAGTAEGTGLGPGAGKGLMTRLG